MIFEHVSTFYLRERLISFNVPTIRYAQQRTHTIYLFLKEDRTQCTRGAVTRNRHGYLFPSSEMAAIETPAQAVAIRR